ncbi:MAG: hypothetical protein KUG79_10495 [Pseudomonadales bacterium]|nr:hypothetical protein [Pseudomonadales bacterium]
MNTFVLLIDANNLIRRIFEASTASNDRLYSDTNYSVTEPIIERVVQAAAGSLRRALNRHPVSHVCMVFDGAEETWRHQVYTQYKQGRKPTPKLLVDNVAKFEQAFFDLGVKSLTLDNYEADDVIATFAQGLANKQLNSLILSSDKSFLQLLSDYIGIYNHFENSALDRAFVMQRFGVTVEQLPDYWSLAGDAVNNIKGVAKIGKKTAVQLLAEFGSLAAILDTDSVRPSILRIQSEIQQVRLCEQLVTLKTDIALNINLKSFRLLGT